RARQSLHVLTCFKPEDLDRTRLAHGAVDLYELLDREIAGNTTLGTPASRAAASEQALGADPLVADLGDRLRARGARVWHQYDGVIDVVAAADPLSTMGQDEAEIPRPVAIESDGTEQYRQMTVRERSRLRPQLLERLGWRYMPLWTIEVFTDPSACADRIGGYLGLEKPAPAVRGMAGPGFFDEDVTGLDDDSYASFTDLDQERNYGPGHGHDYGRHVENQAEHVESEQDRQLQDGHVQREQFRDEQAQDTAGLADGDTADVTEPGDALDDEYVGGSKDRKENAG
ncbi:MAG: family ATPase, partial [Arthrobacter sp.]|nr:family ATPase [Arthrobacter sp.]